MADLEKIVRPFQTHSRTPSNLVASTRGTPENVILQFGKGGGSAQTTSGSYSNQASWYMTQRDREFEFGEIFKTGPL